jgi:rhamnogalacturonyl hydrolase YesR
MSQVYGHEFPEAVYIPGMALLGRLRLGQRAEVERIVEPFVTGAKDSLAKPTASHLAGHLIFAELGNVDLVRRAADLAAKDPDAIYSQMSDAVFMGCPILSAAGKLTGEPKYYDLALRHLRYMQQLDLRADGLYRHSPLNEAAWGRGNAFPALGLALALSYMPPSNPNFAPMLRAYQAHVAELAKFQTADGLWREIVDKPGAYQEFTATAMIGTAMLRGIRNGWLDGKAYQERVDRAWRAITRRTADDGRLIDVCESTGKQKTAEDYLRRTAIMDRDPRGGGMVLFFATELAR